MNLKKKPGLDLSGSFISLLWRWRGSLYKLCYKELICFLVPFGIVSVIYRQVFQHFQYLKRLIIFTLKRLRCRHSTANRKGFFLHKVLYACQPYTEFFFPTGMCSLFEQVVRYCDRYLNMIPLSFILGFYVTIIGIFNQSKKGKKERENYCIFKKCFTCLKSCPYFPFLFKCPSSDR